MKQLERILEWGGTRRDIAFLVISGIALLASLLPLPPLPFDPAWIAIILCGLPIILEAVIGLVTAFDIKADVLVSIALIASVFIGEDFAAGEVAFIMQLGGLLEDLTVARARAGIEKLVHLTPQTARRILDSGEEVIDAKDVRKGDILRVLPGETVPADGTILSGETSINQAVMTGESLPVDKGPGDAVSSGTVNQFGSFDMRAETVGGGQLHPAHDSSRPIRRRGEGQNCGTGGSVGYLGGRCCTHSRRDYLGCHRRNYPFCHHPGCVLPLLFGSRHSHGHHGRHRQRHPSRFAGSGGGCPGAAFKSSKNHF